MDQCIMDCPPGVNSCTKCCINRSNAVSGPCLNKCMNQAMRCTKSANECFNEHVACQNACLAIPFNISCP